MNLPVFFRYYLPALLWWAFTAYLFLLPGSAIPSVGWFQHLHPDKWVHIFLFAVLVWLAFRAVAGPAFRGGKTRALFWILVVAIAYGVAVEFMQKYWVENRSFSLLDIAADAFGCAVAAVLLQVTGRLQTA